MKSNTSAGFYLPVLLIAVFTASGAAVSAQTNVWEPEQQVVTGSERLDVLLPLLEGKQVGLVVNHTSKVGERHLVDTLHQLGVCIARIYVPEHGFRGAAEAGELLNDDQDGRTAAPIVSLYGKKKKPAAGDLDGVDVVVFDIQDVGARFYTYISTLYYVLEACAEQEKPVIVLDRPNPNGHYVDGPVLDMRLSSFVGIAPLPIVHGCTMGELARLFAGECWIHEPYQLGLQVITCENYTHHTPYRLPVRPSPNLPNARSILLYPSICLFEGTQVSIGRGTDWPFQVLGTPDFPNDSFWFVPRPNPGSKYPPHEGWVCKGLDLREIPLDSLRAQGKIDLRYLLEFYRQYPGKDSFFLSNGYFELLAGTQSLREQIVAGKTEAEIRATWEEDLAAFKKIRRKYLLYAE